MNVTIWLLCPCVPFWHDKKKKKKISVVTPAVTFFQNAVTDQVKTCFFTQFFLPDSTKTGYVSLWW